MQTDIINPSAPPNIKSIDFQEGIPWLGSIEIGLQVSGEGMPLTVGHGRSQAMVYRPGTKCIKVIRRVVEKKIP